MIFAKGAKALVISNPPINPPHSLVVGALSSDNYKTNPNLNPTLSQIGRHLNLKVCHNFKFKIKIK